LWNVAQWCNISFQKPSGRQVGEYQLGAKAWFAAYYTHDPKFTLGQTPRLNREASVSFARHLLPGVTLKEQEDGRLAFLNPGQREVFIGVYGDLKIIAHSDLAADLLSRIDDRWHGPDLGATTYVHATHSVVDWCAFALWEKGQLVRALSVAPDGGVLEDIGAKLPFEVPFWDGSFAVESETADEEPYPLPFHPLELSEAALLAILGFQFEGHPDDWVCDPAEIPIMKFEISKNAWWKFW
jgi:hypothetical protein